MSTTIAETTDSRSPVSAPEIGAVEVERPAVTERDVLLRAAYLIEEFGWCQRVYAEDVEGGACSDTRHGERFCFSGAVARALADLGLGDGDGLSGMTYLEQRGLYEQHDIDWNDNPRRTKAEVVAALRAAAERAA